MNVFITGGTTGIGKALAEAYLANGYRVGICGRDESKYHQSFPEKNDRLKFYVVDVRANDQLEKALKDFMSEGGVLDLVIANAGLGMGRKQSIPNFEDMKRVFDTNYAGVTNTFEEALKYMKPQGSGHLVAISSVAAFAGLPGTAAYSASKGAVFNLCESLAIDLHKYGISVTNIAPGFIDTPLTKRNNHPMPFLMPAPKAAQMILKAIEKKKVLYVFPWPMHLLAILLRVVPRAFFVYILRRSKSLNFADR